VLLQVHVISCCSCSLSTRQNVTIYPSFNFPPAELTWLLCRLPRRCSSCMPSALFTWTSSPKTLIAHSTAGQMRRITVLTAATHLGTLLMLSLPPSIKLGDLGGSGMPNMPPASTTCGDRRYQSQHTTVLLY
jgi:hypothetical protein